MPSLPHLEIVGRLAPAILIDDIGEGNTSVTFAMAASEFAEASQVVKIIGIMHLTKSRGTAIS